MDSSYSQQVAEVVLMTWAYLGGATVVIALASAAWFYVTEAE